jgi:hypothetical protein
MERLTRALFICVAFAEAATFTELLTGNGGGAPGGWMAAIWAQTGEFDVNKASLDYPKLFDRPDLVSGQRPSVTGEVEVFAGTGCAPKFLDGLRLRDTADQERIANRFAAAMSMPAKLIRDAREEFDFMCWRDLYKMAEAFEVNISALTVRLQQLGFIYIDENKQFHRSLAEAKGQQQLF